MDIKVFLKGTQLIEYTIQKKFAPEQAEVYKMLLDDLTEEQYINGITRLLRERVYTNIPAPAEIREYSLNLKENDLEFIISEAKNKLKLGIKKAGTYRNICFDDPIIHCIIKSFGGWSKICSSDLEEFENFLKFEFKKLYKAYIGRKTEVQLYFKGCGTDEKDVVFIGSEQKAKHWQQIYISRNSGNLSCYDVGKANVLGIEVKENYIIDKNNMKAIVDNLATSKKI
ncbi:MAG: DUF6475 domain-containing protein [Fusobacteriaceae bacterium]